MTLTQIEYILAISENGSFVEAAKKSCVTQPALTTQVKNLEEELGVMIFDRTKKPIRPTIIGKRIIEQAKNVIIEARKMRDLVQEYQKIEKGDLSIGVIPTVSPYLVPLFVNKFKDNNEGVNISIQEDTTEKIIRKLKNGKIDVGIISTPITTTGIVSIPIYYEKFYAYVSRDSEGYSIPEIKISELSIEDVWLLKEGNCFRDQVINICSGDKITRFKDNFRFQSHSIQSLKRIVDVSNGITLIPEMSILDVRGNNRDMVKALSGEQPMREISLVVTRQFLKRRIIDRLLYCIQDSLPKNIKENVGENIVDPQIIF